MRRAASLLIAAWLLSASVAEAQHITPSGSGTGTISSGVTNIIPKYTAATTIDDSLASDDGTTLTYSGTSGISTPKVTTTGTAGAIAVTNITAPSTPAAGLTEVYVDSTSKRLCSKNDAGTVVCATPTELITKLWLPGAACNNATATLLWDTPVSNPAVAACITGTNTQKGVLDFADSASLSVQITLMLPSDWTATGGVDARFKWLTTATSGDVVWQIATICVADAETDDPAFNTVSTVTDTAKGTTNQTNDATITGVTVTGCAAGELMHVKVLRDSAHASDTLAATARLIGVELTLRRSL